MTANEAQIGSELRRRSAEEPAAATLSTTDERLQTVIELSSDYYWEQDEAHRFTVVRSPAAAGWLPNDPLLYLGKTSWELGSTPVGNHGWEEHRALREARLPFRDFVLCRSDPRAGRRYVSLSGRPVFDAEGRFRGYQGIARDVTKEKRDERLLELERAVMRILVDAEDTTSALRASIRAICESEEWDAGQYWHLDEAHGVMRFNVGWSIDDPTIERVVEQAHALALGPGEGLVGVVWQAREALWIPDLGAEKRMVRSNVVELTGWRNALLFPVFAKGEVIGVLDFNGTIARPHERLLQVIRVLGTQIGNFHQRATALEKLRESEERYSSTVELAAIGIGHVAPGGRFVHVNQRLCDILGYSREELLELTVKQISHPDDVNATDEGHAKLERGDIASMTTEKRYLRKDGTTVWVRLTLAVKRDRYGVPLYDISIVEDISERKRVERRIEYLATHDELTGLPNRAAFGALIDRAIGSASRRGNTFALLFVDLDRFKVINDSLGHEAGDELLKVMSERLRRSVRGNDAVARFGGDEFVVLAQDLRDAEEAAAVARKLLSAALKPVEILGHECRVTASIGIATYPHNGRDSQSLLKNADMAMYVAKQEGKNNYQFYSNEITNVSVERLALENNLRLALEREEFRLHYQAKICAASGRICGVEALLRWWNHELGTVAPAHFIPLAEDTGLIVPIGRWVLETACAQNVEWQRQGLPAISVAVNLSPRQFKDPNLIEDVADVLQRTGMAAELLELEITESVIMHDVEEGVAKLCAIKELGVKLAIDDFGTGYSSLAQLKRFPIDTLKVDRSFIREIPSAAEDDEAIAEAIIMMGKTLGVAVVAEGVETAEQRDFLRSRPCDAMQGYYFGKPTHPDQFAADWKRRL